MKTMTCSQMGGTCDASMTAGSEMEMSEMWMSHIKEAHPELAETVAAMSPEDTATWAEDVHTKWEAAPMAEGDESSEEESETSVSEEEPA